MSIDTVRSGGCLCGAVRFLVKGAPLRVGLCHCQDCRRTSGSAFTFFGVWPRPAYQGAGNLRAFEGRSFCPECGARVASLRGDEAEIMLGTLDSAPSDIIPGYELWIGRREPWLMDLQWAEQFEHDREPRAIDAPSIEPEIPVPPQQPDR
ncbi:GFA family protein [Mesorhizobium sp. 113-3-9]|uniref:GFA family protein n=1 Tax=Mesorhizobium sp. 113-3-9 TaxID=2744517 RepID=UPI0019283E31|nr:GFA family protein [Mesorhizobium sp. 113-3-9]